MVDIRDSYMDELCIKFEHPKPLQKKVMAQNVKKKIQNLLSFRGALYLTSYTLYSVDHCATHKILCMWLSGYSDDQCSP